MTPQRKLSNFMWVKADLMENSLPLEENGEPMELPPYFALEDDQDILSWTDGLSTTVLQILSNNLRGYRHSDMETCPFCIRLQVLVGDVSNRSCRELCGYGERHGICGYDAEENDYDLWSDWIDCREWREELLETLNEGD